MTRLTLLLSAALLTVPALSHASPGNGKGNGNAKVHAAPGQTAACPPGLAKKSPACVPPGLAKKAYPQVGDRIDPDSYILIREPSRYGLDPYYAYYRIDDQVVRVDEETREVLALIGAVSAILN